MKIFKDITRQLNLGDITKPAERIYGGFQHKMYKLQTSSGTYAVKLLNPEIMKRSDAFENYATAEKLEKKLQDNNIPIVPALEFGGKKMQCINNQYFYVFNWVDSTKAPPDCCEIIGKLLAQIHNIEQFHDDYQPEELSIDWDNYIELSKSLCPEVTALLQENRYILYNSQINGNKARKKLSGLNAICHGDMDTKNVLWVDNKPLIIDLECLEYNNPNSEMFNCALCWSGYEDCDLDYNKLRAFLNAYGKVNSDWDTLFHNNFGRLEWLEYNIKRALMIECSDKEEQQLGVQEIHETMEHVVYYDKIKYELLEELSSTSNKASYIILEDMVLLSKKYYLEWREIQDEYYETYKANLPAMTCDELLEYFRLDYGSVDESPFLREEIINFFNSDKLILYSSK
ncbi:MAG: phosphotransferase [Oscillospiraceae bacterium]|nr:phosphotransferase [Oscillospiraceae bacterium]